VSTVTSQDETEAPDTFVGYGPAAEYLGLQRNTLSSYSARGIGPRVVEFDFSGQYRQPVFTKADLDKWRAERPGQGARTDLVEVAV
jgi:hypothetical protein